MIDVRGLRDDPLWYKDALIYELHIRAFKDSNGDGIGDLEGLIEKLDYLVDLGVTAVWLLPFYPSPLRDGGYDIADYTGVHASYGTRRDFARLLREAHRRGLRIITELVLNHTSADHPWFQRARRAPPGSRYRNYYVWSDTPSRYEDTRIIFKDFETSNWSWDPVAKAYFWHRFYAHQPDLNFDNPEVQAELFDVIDFWLEMGVDGLRLDAVPYLFERDGTNCENLPETHAFLKKLRAHIDAKFKNRMLLAEANQWPADAAAYFGDGDECHMNFHFPLMPRMFMAIELEDSFPLVSILKRTPEVHPTCQWATFLRNHDELTLEMVTDEDRDTMYRAYAAETNARINLGIRRRLAPLLGIRRKNELMNALLLSLPGTPVIYYGDEIGMGDNIYLGDRDGVRTPMQWSADRNAGFSRANPQKLYLPPIIDPEFHFEAVNVEAQQGNPSSLLWWLKRLIAKRKEHRLFGRGSIDFVSGDNPRLLCFVREFEGERVLVVANLSRFVQCGRLHLERHRGATPVEMFGRMRFPEIGESPYFVSLGPHGFYWLALESSEGAELRTDQRSEVTCRGDWSEILELPRRTELARILRRHLVQRRFFRGKAKSIKDAAVVDVLRTGSRDAVVLLQVEYQEGGAETYLLPIAAVLDPGPDDKRAAPPNLIAPITVRDVEGRGEHVFLGALVDGSSSDELCHTLMRTMTAQGAVAGEHGQLVGAAFRPLKERPLEPDAPLRSSTAEQTNTSVVFGGRFMLKLLRTVAEGPSTEYELGRFLSSRAGYRGVPRFAGVIEYRAAGRETSTIGTLFEYVPNQGDAWTLTLDALDRYFDRLLSDKERPEAPGLPTSPLLARALAAPDPQVVQWVGPYYDRARLLGRRTAEMHAVLGSEAKDPLFTPTAFDLMHQQSLYQSASTLLTRTIDRLQNVLPELPEDARAVADELLSRTGEIDASLARVTKRKIEAMRIRVHGDYHLGQVLWTGEDFVIIDFEGEPSRPLSQRRFKRNPLRDVAGMLRSFSYASEAALRGGRLRAEDVAAVSAWSRTWTETIAASFLGGYLERASGTALVPASSADVEGLLAFYLLEKCIYEVGYELDNRPDWLRIPMAALLGLAKEAR